MCLLIQPRTPPAHRHFAVVEPRGSVSHEAWEKARHPLISAAGSRPRRAFTGGKEIRSFSLKRKGDSPDLLPSCCFETSGSRTDESRVQNNRSRDPANREPATLRR